MQRSRIDPASRGRNSRRHSCRRSTAPTRRRCSGRFGYRLPDQFGIRADLGADGASRRIGRLRVIGVRNADIWRIHHRPRPGISIGIWFRAERRPALQVSTNEIVAVLHLACRAPEFVAQQTFKLQLTEEAEKVVSRDDGADEQSAGQQFRVGLVGRGVGCAGRKLGARARAQPQKQAGQRSHQQTRRVQCQQPMSANSPGRSRRLSLRGKQKWLPSADIVVKPIEGHARPETIRPE